MSQIAKPGNAAKAHKEIECRVRAMYGALQEGEVCSEPRASR